MWWGGSTRGPSACSSRGQNRVRSRSCWSGSSRPSRPTTPARGTRPGPPCRSGRRGGGGVPRTRQAPGGRRIHENVRAPPGATIRAGPCCECPTRNGRHETAPSSLLEALGARASREEGPVTDDLAETRDRDLVQRIRRGDGEAFRGLFGRYSPSAMSLARRVVRQPFLAEEVVQEAFLGGGRNPGGYDPERGSVRAWLMGMVHHRAVDAVRREESQRRRTEESQLSDPVIQPDPAEDVVDEIGLPEERRAVRAALGGLPNEQRQVIELMYFDGLSQSKISEKLGLPLGTVKSRTLLGMKRLPTALGGRPR